jgi:hypothetical protein
MLCCRSGYSQAAAALLAPGRCTEPCHGAALFAPADVFSSIAYNRVYYLGKPNGTMPCTGASGVCASLWPAGAWMMVSYSSKAQQLQVDNYYRRHVGGTLDYWLGLYQTDNVTLSDDSWAWSDGSGAIMATGRLTPVLLLVPCFFAGLWAMQLAGTGGGGGTRSRQNKIV